MRDVLPIDGEAYEYHYGEASWLNHRVLDLGGSNGDFACWALQKGATSVVTVERDANMHAEAMRNIEGDARVMALCEDIQTGEDLDSLIRKHKPTAIKMDIEGSEMCMLDCSAITQEYVALLAVELHPTQGADESRILNHLIEAGFSIRKATLWAPLITYINGYQWATNDVTMYYAERTGCVL